MEKDKNKIKIVYSEPENYFSDEILKKYKLGKYAETEEDKKEVKEIEKNQ